MTHGRRHLGGCCPAGSSPWSAATQFARERGHTPKAKRLMKQAGQLKDLLPDRPLDQQIAHLQSNQVCRPAISVGSIRLCVAAQQRDLPGRGRSRHPTSTRSVSSRLALQAAMDLAEARRLQPLVEERLDQLTGTAVSTADQPQLMPQGTDSQTIRGWPAGIHNPTSPRSPQPLPGREIQAEGGSGGRYWRHQHCHGLSGGKTTHRDGCTAAAGMIHGRGPAANAGR